MNNTTTNNGKVNKLFLCCIDEESRIQILNAVANQYGITRREAMDEVCHEEAENILEYLTGGVRSAAYVLFQRHALRVGIKA